MMSNLTVFPRRCQVLERVFDEAKSPKEIVIVPVDTAKGTHVARICDGKGTYLYTHPLKVENTKAGLAFLAQWIEKGRRKTGAQQSHVIIAMEDPPPYAANFAYRLLDMKYLVVRVNARDAALKRKGNRATSDTLALDGICRMVMDQQAYELGPECGAFAELRLATVARRRLIQTETALKNMIHRSLEVLFPGFVDIPGIDPFGGPALCLMKDRFHAARFLSMRQETLAEKLRKYGEAQADVVAGEIRTAAENALGSSGLVAEHSFILKQHVETLENLRQSLAAQTRVMGAALAKTDAVYMTTIPGLGVVLASHIAAELGMRGLYGSADIGASYAGIVTRSYQSGGPDSPPQSRHLPTDRNGRLKDSLMQAAWHVGTTPLPHSCDLGENAVHDLMAYFMEKEARREKSRLGTAKRLLGVIIAMAKAKAIYQPPNLFARHGHDHDFNAKYLEGMRAALVRKWHTVNINPKENEDELGHLYKTITDLIEIYRSGTAIVLED